MADLISRGTPYEVTRNHNRRLSGALTSDAHRFKLITGLISEIVQLRLCRRYDVSSTSALSRAHGRISARQRRRYFVKSFASASPQFIVRTWERRQTNVVTSVCRAFNDCLSRALHASLTISNGDIHALLGRRGAILRYVSQNVSVL